MNVRAIPGAYPFRLYVCESNKKGRMPTGDIKKNAALLGRVSTFGYKVASQQSRNEKILCLG
jgi:hypothetical protein